MHMKRQSWIVSLAIVFGILCLLWIFYFPYRPANVLRSVPQEAVAATWHEQPYARQDDILRTAPAVLTLAAIDVPPDGLQVEIADPGTQMLLRKLGSRAMTLAFAPSFGAYGDPALILGAWVGGRMTHLMRSGLMNRAFDGYTVHRIGTDRIWIGEAPDLPPTMRYISFGVYEGVLAGCASSDPFAAVRLLALLRRHGPLPPLIAPWTEKSGNLIKPSVTAFDRLTFLWPTPHAPTISGSAMMTVTQGGTFSAEGHLRGLPVAVIRPGEQQTINNHINRASFPLPDDIAAILAISNLDRAMDAAGGMPPQWQVRPLINALSAIAAPETPVGIWMAGGNQSGRIMRMKVPSLGFAMRLPPGWSIESAATQLTDAINRTHGIGWIAVPSRTDGRLLSFQSIKDDGPSGWLRPEEKPAIAVSGDWLVAMSNAGVLRRLLPLIDERIRQEGSLSTTDLTTWFYGEAHLPEAARAISSAMAGYALFRLVQGGGTERLDTPLIRRLLGSMADLGRISLQFGDGIDGEFLFRMTADGIPGEKWPQAGIKP